MTEPTGWDPPARSYLVLATARTGSSLLCDYLTATGRAGRPDEYFLTSAPRGALQPPTWLEKRSSMEPLAYLSLLGETGSTPDGTFGAKANTVGLRNLMKLLRSAFPQAGDDRQLLLKSFPGLRVLLMTRLDKVAQAVSTLKAIETGKLSSLSGPTASSERYSFPLIEMFINDIVAEERGLARWAAELGQPFRTVSYEDLAADPNGSLASILKFLGIDPNGITPTSRLQRQADASSEEWAERQYRRKLRLVHRLLLAAGLPSILRNAGLRRYFISSRRT